ncbi:ThiF family protein (fragment) [uncultured delta proteobacterium]|uniref:ThiF family protein n=1 Tax=uncultured delta proteobacterium TaxID=34034 RepID=A0A212K9U4_9DELT
MTMAAPLPSRLDTLLAPFCTTRNGPGSGSFRTVTLEGARALAEHCAVSLRDAMMTVLEHDIWPLRFARNRGVFSAADQRKLLASHAAVIGCGGLGGHVATLLARVGVGALTLCDPDMFDESNLNRQLVCTEQNLGRNKALAAREAVSAIASHTRITVHPVAARPDNLAEILTGADIAMDCLDSLETRRHLAAAASEAQIPMVYATVAGDEGFTMLVRPGDKSLRSLCGSEDSGEKTGAETTLGVPTITPAATAAIQAALAIQCLLGKEMEEPLLLHLDLTVPQIDGLAL